MPAPDEIVDAEHVAPDPTRDTGYDHWADTIDPQGDWMAADWDIDDTPGHWSGCDTRAEYEGTR